MPGRYSLEQFRMRKGSTFLKVNPTISTEVDKCHLFGKKGGPE